MDKLAIIGFTPREEVIVRRIREQLGNNVMVDLFLLGRNPALEGVVDRVHAVDLDRIDETIVGPVQALSPAVVLIGPDKFSIAGVKERLTAAGIPAIGSDREQIQIETSKALLRRRIPSLRRFYPPYRIFSEYNETDILGFIADYPDYVVKYDGPFHEIGGGVRLSGLHLCSIEETLAYVHESLQECGAAVLEEQIKGQDFSVNALTAGDGSVFFFPDNICYKLRDEGDLGPNTSGTGSIAYADSLPFLSYEQVETAHDIVREVVRATRAYFRRPLITGLNVDMRLGRDGKVYLFEVNARFAGAGTLSTVTALCKNDLMSLFAQALGGSFNGTTPLFESGCSVSVFAFPHFFPGGQEDGREVIIPKASAMPEGVRCFTGWVEVKEEMSAYRRAVLKNSTTLLFETRAATPEECRRRLYSELAKLPKELTYRRDIGL